jgi:hypothetical protein
MATCHVVHFNIRPVVATLEKIEWSRIKTQVQFRPEFDPKKTLPDDPFMWWKAHENRFPVLAPVARMWLGCVATSVPSERAFSTSGNIVTARRCSLAPTLVRDLVFIAENNK